MGYPACLYGIHIGWLSLIVAGYVDDITLIYILGFELIHVS